MANYKIGNPQLQLYTTKNFAGMTEENHLKNAFLTQPYQMRSVISYMLSDTYYSRGESSVLPLLTDGIGTTEEVDNSEVRWDIFGQNERAIDVIGNYGDGGTTPGYNKSSFRVKLAEKWFAQSDVLFADDKTMVRVQFEPVQDGGGYMYTLQLNGGDLTKFIDPIMITAGARFSKAYSTVEEFSDKGGNTTFAAPFKMKNRLTTLRKNHAVTRTAATDVLIMELPSPNDPGKTTKYWFRLAEWAFMAQWAKEKDFMYIYGQYSSDAITGINGIAGANGRPVMSGAGLREQISPANIRYYNQLTYKLLDDTLLDLSYNATANGGNHKFVALTGKMGMRMFSDAVNDKFRSLGVTIVNEGRFISGTGNELVFTGDQWRTAHFPNGVSLTIREIPLYDDLISNRTLHPESLRPIESYRFTIFNIGNGKDGKANVRKVVKKNSQDLMWNVSGSIDPYVNPAKSFGTNRATGKDGFEIFGLTEEAIILADPTSAAEIIMDAQ